MRGNPDQLVHLAIRVLEAILVLKVSKGNRAQKATRDHKDQEERREAQAIRVHVEMLEVQAL